MEYLINQEEQDQIRKAIEKFEKKSSAEIVTVIAKESDAYLLIPTLWAAIGSLTSSWLLIGLFDRLDQKELSLVQLSLFAVLALLAQLKPVKMFLVPSFIKKKRSSAMAKNKFLELLEQDTQKDGLVMLFVSETERYVEILADAAVTQKVDNALWSDAIENFILQVKAGNIAQGYLETIEKTTALLAELFPETKEDRDDLPNHLIMI